METNKKTVPAKILTFIISLSVISSLFMGMTMADEFNYQEAKNQYIEAQNNIEAVSGLKTERDKLNKRLAMEESLLASSETTRANYEKRLTEFTENAIKSIGYERLAAAALQSSYDSALTDYNNALKTDAAEAEAELKAAAEELDAILAEIDNINKQIEQAGKVNYTQPALTALTEAENKYNEEKQALSESISARKASAEYNMDGYADYISSQKSIIAKAESKEAAAKKTAEEAQKKIDEINKETENAVINSAEYKAMIAAKDAKEIAEAAYESDTAKLAALETKLSAAKSGLKTAQDKEISDYTALAGAEEKLLAQQDLCDEFYDAYIAALEEQDIDIYGTLVKYNEKNVDAGETYDALCEALDELEEAYDNALDAWEADCDAIEELKEQIEDLQFEYDAAEADKEDFTDSFSSVIEAREAYRLAVEAYESLSIGAAEMKSAQEALEKAIEEHTKALEELQEERDSLTWLTEEYNKAKAAYDDAVSEETLLNSFDSLYGSREFPSSFDELVSAKKAVVAAYAEYGQGSDTETHKNELNEKLAQALTRKEAAETRKANAEKALANAGSTSGENVDELKAKADAAYAALTEAQDKLNAIEEKYNKASSFTIEGMLASDDADAYLMEYFGETTWYAAELKKETAYVADAKNKTEATKSEIEELNRQISEYNNASLDSLKAWLKAESPLEYNWTGGDLNVEIKGMEEFAEIEGVADNDYGTTAMGIVISSSYLNTLPAGKNILTLVFSDFYQEITGEKYRTLTINVNAPVIVVKKEIADLTISGINESYEWTGTEIVPAAVITDNGYTLVKDADYSVEYKNNIDAGMATAIITGIGDNYKGTKTIQFGITAAIIVSKLPVSGINASYTWTGKAIVPSVSIQGLKKDIDYTVSVSNNINVGTATVKITGKGNYKGTMTRAFSIIPKSTKVSKIKAAKKKITVRWKKQTKETTGYQIQYSLKKNFSSKTKTIDIKKNKTTKKIIKKLKSKKTCYVRVRAYKTINGVKYYSGWSKVKKVKVK